MINGRNLVISISFAVLSAATSMCAQYVKPAGPAAVLQRPAMIQELQFQPQRLLALTLQAESVSPPVINAPDLSGYRGFRFGMSLPAAAKQADVESSEARVIHQRPALIQELEWRPQRSLGSTPEVDPVREVTFSFYNGELFRMVVSYDQDNTAGLTDGDMVEALSAKYGTATRPAEKIILFSSFLVYNESEKVMARWADSQYSFNLFRSSYQPDFGMLLFSKRLDALAQSAIAEAVRLDERDAPQIEIARQKKQDEENRAAQEKARLVNKPAFRP